MNKPCARITLDLQQASTPTFVAVKKSDIGREIRITLSDGGFPYEISADCYAVLTGTKPDGNILYNHCDIEGNTIVYEITEQTTAAAGRMKAEVKLYGADDILVTSATFRIIIDGTVYTDDKVESSSEFSALRQLMSQVLEIIKNNSGESGGGISITIVKELPTEDISTNTLYLVKDADVPSNIYTEYMYVNGEWEIIGSQQLNLSGYVKTVNSTGPDGNGNVDVVGISSVSRVEPIGKGTHTTQIQLTNGDTIDISVTDGEDGTDGFNGSDGAAVYLWDSSVGDLGSGRYSQTGITLPNGKYPKNGDTLISKDGGVYLVTNYYMASFEPVFQFSIGGSGNSSGGNADQSGGNGLSSTEKTLMLSLFKNTIFATDMTSTIAQLEAYWNGSGGSGDSGGNEGGGDTGGDSGDEPGGDTPPVVETLPSWIAEMEVVEFTPEADTNTAQTFAINMDDEPNMVVITSDIEEKIAIRDFVSAVCTIEPVTGATNCQGIITNVTGFTSGSIGLEVSTTAVTITTPNLSGTNCYWRAGHTYKVYCVKTVSDVSDMTHVPSFAKETYALTFTPESKTNEAQTFAYEMENEPNVVWIFTDYTESGSVRDFYGVLARKVSGAWAQNEIFRTSSATVVEWVTSDHGVTSCADGLLVYQTDVYGGTCTYWLPDRTYYIIFMYL